MQSGITEKLPGVEQGLDKNDELILGKNMSNEDAQIKSKDKRNFLAVVPSEILKKKALSSKYLDCESVSRLAPEDIEKAAGVIAKAFLDYPLPGQYIRDIARRKKALEEMFKVELRKALKKGSVYTLGGDFQEVAIWKHDLVPESDFNYIKYFGLGTFKLLLHVKMKEAIRLFKALRNIVDTKIKLSLPGNTVELYIVGVNPANQGQGRLSKLLKPVLKEMQEQEKPVLVMTNTDSNRKIYEHLGFTLIEVLDDKENDCTAYYLVK